MKFTCDYCKTGCSTKGNILSHMRLKHTPHRKFKCAICAEKSKIYNQKKNARIHLKKNHFGGPGIFITKKLRKRIDRKIIEIKSDEQTPATFQHVDMDTYAYEALKRCLRSEYRALVPLKTKGDGNCMVHAVCMEAYGRDDVNYSKRKELHEFFLQGSSDFKNLWKSQEEIWADESGFSFDERDFDLEWESVVNLASAEISQCSSRLPLRSLENIHVFALANMLKRTIIVIADKWHYFNGEAYTPEKFGGIYLPILNDSENCKKLPIIIGYSHNHFNAMATCTGQGDMLFPLIDCDDGPLPIHYCSPMGEKEKVQLLKKYLNLRTVKKSRKKLDLYVEYEELSPGVNGENTYADNEPG